MRRICSVYTIVGGSPLGLRVRGFVWDEHNSFKPGRHSITIEEAEEVFYNNPQIRLRRETWKRTSDDCMPGKNEPC